MNLRQYLQKLSDRGALRTVRAEANPYLEIPAMLHQDPDTPILFERAKGCESRVTGNLYTSRERLAEAIGAAPGEFLMTVSGAVKERRACPLTQTPACQEKVWRNADLRQLPILRHFADDGGPFVTAGLLVVDDPQYGRNVAFHRLMVVGKNRVTTRVVEGRGTWKALQNTKGECEVAICIGAPAHVMLTGAMSVPDGVDELEVAQALASTPVARCLTNSLEVPAESEIVIEGRFTGKMGNEGPFVDLTGTWDFVRQQPVIEVDAITSRADAIYEALMPAMLEHKALMGIPREADIFRALGRICRCLDVRVTPGGCSWLHAVIRIDKQRDDEPKGIIEAAFRAHQSLKMCTVVDADIDPLDPLQVEWAIATRFQADRDTVILADRPGSSLDPSALHVAGAKSTGAKLGLDATMKGADRSKYQKAFFPALNPERRRELLGE
jgi:2,5-furandicarboxylate decarboxylase 1